MCRSFHWASLLNWSAYLFLRSYFHPWLNEWKYFQQKENIKMDLVCQQQSLNWYEFFQVITFLH